MKAKEAKFYKSGYYEKVCYEKVWCAGYTVKQYYDASRNASVLGHSNRCNP